MAKSKNRCGPRTNFCSNRLTNLIQRSILSQPNYVNMKKENFNPSGNTVTVSSTVNFLVAVFVDGVYYSDQNGDYTRSGTTITFTDSMAGRFVEVIYF